MQQPKNQKKMEWTGEILELIKEAGFKNTPITKFPTYFLTCPVGKMLEDAKTNKELSKALLQYEENRKVYLRDLLFTLAKEKSNIAISLGKTLGILTDIQKIEFEEISTADRLAKFMKDADDEI